MRPISSWKWTAQKVSWQHPSQPWKIISKWHPESHEGSPRPHERGPIFSDCVTYLGWNEKNMHDLFGSDCSNQNANNNDQFPNTQMVRKKKTILISTNTRNDKAGSDSSGAF